MNAENIPLENSENVPTTPLIKLSLQKGKCLSIQSPFSAVSPQQRISAKILKNQNIQRFNIYEADPNIEQTFCEQILLEDVTKDSLQTAIEAYQETLQEEEADLNLLDRIAANGLCGFDFTGFVSSAKARRKEYGNSITSTTEASKLTIRRRTVKAEGATATEEETIMRTGAQGSAHDDSKAIKDIIILVVAIVGILVEVVTLVGDISYAICRTLKNKERRRKEEVKDVNCKSGNPTECSFIENASQEKSLNTLSSLKHK